MAQPPTLPPSTPPTALYLDDKRAKYTTAIVAAAVLLALAFGILSFFCCKWFIKGVTQPPEPVFQPRPCTTREIQHIREARARRATRLAALVARADDERSPLSPKAPSHRPRHFSPTLSTIMNSSERLSTIPHSAHSQASTELPPQDDLSKACTAV